MLNSGPLVDKTRFLCLATIALQLLMMAAASVASYYSPLDPISRTIRLLLLSPNRSIDDQRIQCSLVETSLDGARPFEALSYTWGMPDDLDLKIYLNGTLVTIRRNLWVALHYLQKDISRDRVLWIDALCIHQEDTKERNHQVGFMGDIFKQAKVVLAWLGEPSSAALHNEILSDCELNEPTTWHKHTTSKSEDAMHSSRLAFDMLKAAATGADALNIDVDMVVPVDRLDRWFMEFVQNPGFVAQWKLILELCSAEYWNRLWVIQEIGLANRVMVLYGNAHCDWDDFSKPISILSYWSDTFSRRFTDAAGEKFLSLKRSPAAKFVGNEFRRQQQDGEKRPRGLTYLLSISENSHCQERRDRIYGLLGFLDEDERGQIPVDYSKTLYQIFEDVIKSSIRQRSSDPALLVHFSEVLQRTLLAPLEKDSDACQMFGDETASTLWGNWRQGNQHSHKKCGAFEAENFAEIKSIPSSLLSTNEEFELHAKVLGPIQVVEVQIENIVVDMRNVWFKPRAEDRGEPPNKRKRLGWRENASGPSSKDHGIQRISPYAFKFRDLWRADHKILIESGPAQPTNKSLSAPQNELNDQVVLFEVTEPEWFLKGDGYIGIANNNIQNGDFLCTFPPSEVTAVIRCCNYDGEREDDKDFNNHRHVQYNFIGRAVVTTGQVQRDDELVNSLTQRNWPPPDFSLGYTILDYNDKSGTMAPRRWRVGHVDKPSIKSARILITLNKLQALTCPLKRRNYEEHGSLDRDLMRELLLGQGYYCISDKY
jgi:hypothetical protein